MHRNTLLVLVAVVVVAAASGCGEGTSPLDPDSSSASTDASTPPDASRADGLSDAGSDGASAAIGADAAAPDAAAPDAGCGSPEALSVYLIGDSTVASGSGWGDFLQTRMRAGVVVTNAARSGQSSKSFYDAGNFDGVRSALIPGSYVLIQFGHNDSKPEAYRRTDPGVAPGYTGTFRDYVERYISEARAAGATPILVTSVSRMVFSGDGTIRRSHGEYPPAIRQIALDNEVVMLDLEQRSYEIFTELGETQSLQLYAADGDRTHFPPDKGFRVTEMVTDLLRESASPLRCSLNE